MVPPTPHSAYNTYTIKNTVESQTTMSSVSNEIIVLITGGNTGLGFASIQSLVSTKTDVQYTILMGCRTLSKAIKAIESLGSIDTRHHVYPVVMDIDDDKVVDEAYDEVEKTYGRLDVLINNAGTSLSNNFIRVTCRQDS
jgi:NAD(P)-dependent dehydrogenase (short-subunit alcohol dehydrogenase family)